MTLSMRVASLTVWTKYQGKKDYFAHSSFLVTPEFLEQVRVRDKARERIG